MVDTYVPIPIPIRASLVRPMLTTLARPLDSTSVMTAWSLQVGANIILPEYADMEYVPSFYTNTISPYPPAVLNVSIPADGNARYNTQYVRCVTTATTSTLQLYFSS